MYDVQIEPLALGTDGVIAAGPNFLDFLKKSAPPGGWGCWEDSERAGRIKQRVGGWVHPYTPI